MVPYSIGSIDKSRMNEKQKQLIDLPIDIFFNIGDLSVAASREVLSNDERTIGNILKALDGVHEKLIDQVKEELKRCKTAWEARLKIFEMINTKGIGGFVNEALNAGQFNGIHGSTFDNEDPSINELDYPNLLISHFHSTYRRTLASKRIMSMTAEQKKNLLETKRERDRFNLRFERNKEVTFVLNDVGFGGEKYIHFYLQDASDNKGDSRKKDVYLISRTSKDIPTTYVVKEGMKIIEAVGTPPVLLLSELKTKYKPLMSPVSKQPVVKKDVVFFDEHAYVKRYRDGYQAKAWNDAWKVSLAQDPGRKFYIPLKRLAPVAPVESSFEFAEQLKKFIQAVRGSKIFNLGEKEVIYGLPEASPLRKDSEWKEFFPEIFSQLKKKMTPAKELELSLHIHPFQSSMDKVLEDIAKKHLLDPKSKMQQFCDSLANARKYDKTAIEFLGVVINKLGKYTPKHVINFSEVFQELFKVYPLLKFVDISSWEKGTDQLVEYIKLMDKKKEEEEKLLLAEQQTEVYTILPPEKEVETVN